MSTVLPWPPDGWKAYRSVTSRRGSSPGDLRLAALKWFDISTPRQVGRMTSPELGHASAGRPPWHARRACRQSSDAASGLRAELGGQAEAGEYFCPGCPAFRPP